MTQDEMKALKLGDVVRHKSSSDGYIVTANYGTRVMLVRTADMTNPEEWSTVLVVSHPLTVDWIWANRLYYVRLNNESVHCTNNEIDRDLFIAQLKQRLGII